MHMASLAPVYLPAGVWVDLYDATSITVGTQINAHNAFSPDIYLVEGNTTPAPLKTVPSARDVGVRVIEKGQDRVN